MSSEKKTIKLRLSQKKTAKVESGEGNGAASASNPGSRSDGSKPKVSLKLRVPTAAPQETESQPKQEKQAKPKLKLSLSLSKKKQEVASTKTGTQKKSLPPSRGKQLPTGVASGSGPASSRGKQLPTGVASGSGPASSPASSSKPSTQKIRLNVGNAQKPATSKAKKSSKTPASTAAAAASTITPAPMNPIRKAQCSKILLGLKRRQPEHSRWFRAPIPDDLMQDYRAKIPFPMDLGTLQQKLDKNEYPTIADFVRDLRRIFANCLRYNTGIKDSFRPVAVEMLSTAEDLLAIFVLRTENPATVVYPRLLYCWKLCVTIVDALLEMVNPTDGHQTAHYFLHPVSFYFGGSFPEDYRNKVKKPVDFGTVTSMLMEGDYPSVPAFAADCFLVCQNCKAYYMGREDGAVFVEHASRLQALMDQKLGALKSYDQSPAAAQARNAPVAIHPAIMATPPPQLLKSVLAELRSRKYTDRLTKLTHPATLYFEDKVDLSLHPDYPIFVQMPMDLKIVDARIASGYYLTLEDFEYDVTLIFRNCENYNKPKRNKHMLDLAKFGRDEFQKILSARLRGPGDSSTPPAKQPVVKPKEESQEGKGDKKRPRSPSAQKVEAKPAKVAKVTKVEPVQHARKVPRISIQASMLSADKPAAKATSKTLQRSDSSGTSKKKAEVASNSDAGGPMHVAIAQIKERYGSRRPYKNLTGWEGECGKFFRELMRHPWLSAAKPKFLYHVPVPVLFPHLKDDYSRLIERPMDLTTAEARLLHGGIYRAPKEFVEDVAVIFANAITFNQGGHDDGDPLSCAYFDSSKHLLRYCRWLSLEYLTLDSSDSEPDVLVPDDPPRTWKLTVANKMRAREEMDGILMNEPIEKSIEGDRYTWMESECEKLLKALRHQSDLKYMQFFIHTQFPVDYAMFIKKPIDWGHCQRTLQKRGYNAFKEIVEDLRLIFSNALKYNARAKGTETVSGHAYDAAVYMSAKLEAAIDRMVLSVSERLERERVEHTIAEREIEAQEKEEEARIRAAWLKEGAGAAPENQVKVETVQTVRIIQRKPPRRETMDFEIPLFEEEEGHQEHSQAEAVAQQKLVFERQRARNSEMRKFSRKAGLAVFERLEQHEDAIAWAREQAKAAAKEKQDQRTDESGKGAEKARTGGSSVSTELEKKERPQIKMKIRPKTVIKAKKRPLHSSLEL